MVLEQPGGVETQLATQGAILHDFAVERLVGLVDVAGRRGLEAEG